MIVTPQKVQQKITKSGKNRQKSPKSHVISLAVTTTLVVGASQAA